MTPQFRIEVTRRAAGEIRRAAAWWCSHRSKAPSAFREDLRQAFALLSAQPQVGVRARDVTLPGVRRLHLTRIRYYVYYRVLLDAEVVQILALWHMDRAGEPTM